ncbi:hypothetical protein Poly21_21160 [Allorhodopirellula heiligendammensis]|uniref:Uncharacterized protein n=1 Tax=Allorhodopirellula heiligendammensis TaxID=2714739 RepID=A0A5C6C7D7_9BACT|nr:hypothetical protein Poly21_21160 [Allorhodopirellula heiligendammensis]
MLTRLDRAIIGNRVVCDVDKVVRCVEFAVLELERPATGVAGLGEDHAACPVSDFHFCGDTEGLVL